MEKGWISSEIYELIQIKRKPKKESLEKYKDFIAGETFDDCTSVYATK